MPSMDWSTSLMVCCLSDGQRQARDFQAQLGDGRSRVQKLEPLFDSPIKRFKDLLHDINVTSVQLKGSPKRPVIFV